MVDALAARAPDSADPAGAHRPGTRLWLGKAREPLPLPHLIEVQLRSFEWFATEGLREVFAEISPIADFTGKSLELELAVGAAPFRVPKYTYRKATLESSCAGGARPGEYAGPVVALV
jgi:DNA-directed RNA polymerase beta subunit